MKCPYCGCKLTDVESYDKSKKPAETGEVKLYVCMNHLGFNTEEEAREYADKNSIETEDWQRIACKSNDFWGHFYCGDSGELHKGYPYWYASNAAITGEKLNMDRCTSKAIYLLVGASGSGKTTLGDCLRQWDIPEIKSHSTRLKREGESEGLPYYFVTDEEFDQIDFIETAPYDGSRYGTSRQEIERVLSSNDTTFAIVERNGVVEFRKIYGDMVRVVCVYTPLTESIVRMKARNDTPEKILNRIEHALSTNEQDLINIADYCILNNDLDEAKRQLKCIVRAWDYEEI